MARTFIEMEFFNPGNTEVEGNRTFQLNRGQVITAFQLALNGKYRDGSIEERWKATMAYNNIVGKRMDPAILSMNANNEYSLHIYPVPAHGSRKITMTITQLMNDDNNSVTYDLPLNFSDYTDSFGLKINISNIDVAPHSNAGILQDKLFNFRENSSSFFEVRENIQLNRPVSFSIPLSKIKPQVCISKLENQTRFVCRVLPEVQRIYVKKPSAISVFWDVSKSSSKRHLSKELDFLEKYIIVNNIVTTRITLFNHKVLNTLVYRLGVDRFTMIRNYLLDYEYTGATSLGNLDFSREQADAILVFSDGYNSYGKSQPPMSTVELNCIVSGTAYNKDFLRNMIGASGGDIIDLNSVSTGDAIIKSDNAENFLLRYSSKSGGIHVNEDFPIRLGKSILITGTSTCADSLQLLFGNNSVINKSLAIYLNNQDNCEKDLYETIKMLRSYDLQVYEHSINGHYNFNWRDMIYFGLKERVITPQTSYLVLEKIEDYINYKIAPPKELEEKCAEMNYVYKSEYKARELKTFTEKDLLTSVVNNYNDRIKWWDKQAELIDLEKAIDLPEAQNLVGSGKTQNQTLGQLITLKSVEKSPIPSMNNNIKGQLTEVVVTALGIRRQAKELGYSTSIINSDELNRAKVTNLATGLASKVAGLQVNLVNNGIKQDTRILLRGNRSIQGNNQPLIVLDNIRIPQGYLSSLNPYDIETVTILKGASASALYGSDASNGVIILTGKKGRKDSYYSSWHQYKLSNAIDIEYMQEIARSDNYEIMETYSALEKDYGTNAGFYFDMADFFFKRGQHQRAKNILYNAAEFCDGNRNGLVDIAYTLESWMDFDEAINIYKNILIENKNDLAVRRDLALAYFQNGKYQEAVDNYYSIITSEINDDFHYGNLKQIALNEMNAVIALHKDKLNLSMINLKLVRILGVDLRISIEDNMKNYIDQVKVEEPSGESCSIRQPDTKSGGHFTSCRNDHYFKGEAEYSIKNAKKGSYRVIMDTYNYYESRIPCFVRVIEFKNFQRPNQTLVVKTMNLDNQYGAVEIEDINW